MRILRKNHSSTVGATRNKIGTSILAVKQPTSRKSIAMGPHYTVCCVVLSLTIVGVVGRSFPSIDDPLDEMNFKAEKDRPDEDTEKPWQAHEDGSAPENDEGPNIDGIQRYLNRVAYLYKKTKSLLDNLKSTIHNDLSESVDELGKHVDIMVNKKISFIRPYLRSLLRANSRSLLGNMMKRMMHHRRRG
uniref:Leucine--tRNA ligase n=1 Tax=Lygus hesperus TaxID=30085 RepID=A0A0A9XRE8_LYGHE